MAQNPVGLQEPSMDELLASIREIIEESSAAAEAAELTSGDQNPLDATRKILPDATGEKSASGTDDNSLMQATMPIHDAMKALAARIGLKKQEAVSDGTSRTGNGNNSAVSGGIDGEQDMKKTPSTPTSFMSPPTVTIAPAPAGVAIDPFSFGRVNVVPPQNMAMPTPQPLPQMSLSASIAAASASNAKSNMPQATKISPKPQVKKQEKAPSGFGHIPLNPQFRTLPLAQQSPAPSQDSSVGKQPVQPPITATTMPPVAPIKEPKQALTDLEKGFLAEFEQSAELLLRPYIASWLEEHFHHLFEKILREEIQRLMQKNLRR